MKRNTIVATLAALAGAVAVATGVASPEDSLSRSADSSRAHVERFDASLRVPPGWHRSRQRLVPKLLRPREIFSIGTFGMAVGGGGNCGREPQEAIWQMDPGDALVSVQEYGVTRRMRRRLGWAFPPVRELSIGRLAPAWVGAARGVVSATIPFSAGGRAFDALVYFAGRPTSAERAEVLGILRGMRFGPEGPFTRGGHVKA